MNATEIKAQNEAEEYFFIVYGDVPKILTPCVAYRRAGRQDLRDIRVINCPYCNKPLTEVSKDTKVELYRYPARKKIRCQAYPVCQTCKNEVGIILA